MCGQFDPEDQPCGFCVPCDRELFQSDIKEFGNHKYLTANEGHPVCPVCGLIDIDGTGKRRVK